MFDNNTTSFRVTMRFWAVSIFVCGMMLLFVPSRIGHALTALTTVAETALQVGGLGTVWKLAVLGFVGSFAMLAEWSALVPDRIRPLPRQPRRSGHRRRRLHRPRRPAQPRLARPHRHVRHRRRFGVSDAKARHLVFAPRRRLIVLPPGRKPRTSLS